MEDGELPATSAQQSVSVQVSSWQGILGEATVYQVLYSIFNILKAVLFLRSMHGASAHST